MPGPRGYDWAHVAVVGAPRSAGEPYLSFGQRLLGYTKAQAHFNRLQVHKVTKKLEDGAVVVAEIHGKIPKITIYPPPAGPAKQSVVVGDFVVFPRDQEHPDGIDTEHPELILRHRGKESWTSYDYDIYGSPSFPDGLEYSGTCDWEGPRGERVSWYGPMGRYWFDLYRHSTKQYGRFVFCMGTPLLDLDAYQVASSIVMGGYITGACVRGQWLYVFLAGLADVDPLPPIGRAGDMYVTPPYLNGNIGVQLWRFKIKHNPLVDADVPQWEVETGSHHRLLNLTIQAGCNPWVFSADGRTAEMFAMPAVPHIRRYRNSGDTYDFDAPSTSAAHHTVTISESGYEAEIASENLWLDFSQPNGECVIAADYTRENKRVELKLGFEQFRAAPTPGPEEYPNTGFWHRFYLSANGQRMPLFEPNAAGMVGQWHTLFTADLRHGAAVLLRREQVNPSFLFEERLVAYHKGKLVYNKLTATKTIMNPDRATASWPLLLNQLGQAHVAAMCLLVGACIFGDYDHPPGDTDPVQGYNRTAFALPYYYQDRAQAWGYIAIYNRLDGTTALALVHIPDFITASQFCSQPQDALGHASAWAMACDEDVLMYSGPAGLANWTSGGITPHHFISGATFEDLTGLNGTQTRFHPLWRLGKPLTL